MNEFQVSGCETLQYCGITRVTCFVSAFVYTRDE